MSAYYSDAWLDVYQGDCRAVLAELPAESVHCVVTSPPYWGLRDYGTEATVWDGDIVCAGRDRLPHHEWADDGRCTSIGCQSWRGGLGLEPTPELFVRDLVSVFREVRRVLRDDGTVWLNLGDSYAAGRGGTMMPAETLAGGVSGQGDTAAHRGRPQVPDNKNPNAPARTYQPHRNAEAIGLKHKDLVGIPWRVAFALQADGWYLRSDIIWSKPNPMPESVTDRPTKSHEYLFLLSKKSTYYFDADAVRETSAGRTDVWPQSEGRGDPGGWSARPSKKRGEFNGKTEAMPGRNAFRAVVSERNIRSVWTIATQPYPGAHFATFPRKLVEPCIKAGTSERGVCPECGAPWVRVVSGGDGTYADRKALGYDKPANVKVGEHPGHHRGIHPPGMTHTLTPMTKATTGWRATCEHLEIDDAETGIAALHRPIPATVLDIFAGSGTTGLVAQSLSRRAILIDLNADYLIQAMGRNRDIPLGLAG